MNAKFDPYDELGLKKGATADGVRRAYRRRAKETHPDQPGGDKDAFVRAGQALAILINPKKRAKFDETGEVEEEKNKQAEAVGLVAAAMGEVLNSFVKSGFRKDLDVVYRDVIAEMDADLAKQINDRLQLQKVGARVRQAVIDMRSRLSGTTPQGDMIRQMLEASLLENTEAQNTLAREIEVRRMARGFLKHYKYRADEFFRQRTGGLIIGGGMLR